MKCIKPLTKLLGLSTFALVLTAGCADRNKNDVPDSPATTPEISKTVDKATDTASKALKEAVPAIEKGVSELADAAKDKATTATVKTAILGNAALKGTSINVDTVNKTVWLAGTVKNPAQKRVAGDIAKKKATGYNIKNELKVAGGKAAKKN